MLNSPHEYQKMSEVEDKLWWYRVLHEHVLDLISDIPKTTKILDVGCGTGGMLQALRRRGFVNLSAGDVSEFAIEECLRKGFQVSKLDIMSLKKSPLMDDKYGVIISNDVFYFAPPQERRRILTELSEVLNESGLLILNLPVFAEFAGVHDRSVGLTQRIVPKDFLKLIDGLDYTLESYRFWPALLSPLILLARTIQRRRLSKSKAIAIQSDIDLPPKFINHFLYFISRMEKYFPLFPRRASSMLLCLRKKTLYRSSISK